MIYDREFLRELDAHRNRVIYARVTAMTFQEEPTERIEGRITLGSINVDGASAMRRTCNLTMVANDVNINDFYWGLNTKINLEIGLENTINPMLDDIIWFKEGVYILTSFNISLTASTYTITIGGKDKMCLLNGEVGGTLNSSVDFGQVEETDENQITTITKYPIRDIIKDSVHEYAGEPFNNIIINDLEDLGLELLEYRYDDPMYLIRRSNEDTYFNGTMVGDMECWKAVGDHRIPSTIAELEHYDLLVSSLDSEYQSDLIYLDSSDETYCVAKIEYGQTGGYRTTDLVYAGDLIMNVGESLTTMLDKIVAMLGEYEYFYDIDGRFVFQKKPIYASVDWTPQVSNEDEITFTESLALSSSTIYTFDGGELLTNITNTPTLTNLKNDYSAWGVRVTTGGIEVPVHMRYVIDIKPSRYMALDGTIYTDDEWDWRELIYQMALDYRKHNHDDDFEVRIAQNNPDDYPTGQTGYEPYYIDLEGFWRQLYNPNPSKDEQSQYYTKLDDYPYWNKDVYNAPQKLNFWIDFLDFDGELQRFSARAIGNRPKVINKDDIKAIYFRDTPMIIFTTPEKQETEERKSGYRYFQASNLETMFALSTQGKSAKTAIEEMLYANSYCTQNVTISCVPIYYLDVNNRIQVSNTESGIEGEYIINKMTIPLTYNGTMSITANRATQRIL